MLYRNQSGTASYEGVGPSKLTLGGEQVEHAFSAGAASGTVVRVMLNVRSENEDEFIESQGSTLENFRGLTTPGCRAKDLL
jgi:hypothetical protein